MSSAPMNLRGSRLVKTLHLDSPLFMFVILSISLMNSQVASVSPILPYLAERFPDQSQTAIQGFMSFPMAAVIVATLLSGVLANKLGKRRMVVAGILCMIGGGIAPLALIPLNNYPLIIAARLVAGIGMGLIQPMSSALISDFYQGTKKSAVLGWQSSVVGTGSILWSLVVSGLITGGWVNAFFVYLAGLIILVLVVRYVPDPTWMPSFTHTDTFSNGEKVRLPRGIWYVLGIAFLMGLTFQSNVISTPFLAVQRGLADGPQIGLVMSVFGVASVVAGLIFGKVVALLRMWTGPVALLVMAGAVTTALLAQSLGMLFLMAILFGLSFGTFMPFAISALLGRATEKNSAPTSALYFASGGIAGFLAPFYYNGIGSLLGSSSAETQFAIALVTVLVAAVLAFIYFPIDARYTAEFTGNQAASTHSKEATK